MNIPQARGGGVFTGYHREVNMVIFLNFMKSGHKISEKKFRTKKVGQKLFCSLMILRPLPMCPASLVSIGQRLGVNLKSSVCQQQEKKQQEQQQEQQVRGSFLDLWLRHGNNQVPAYS